MVEEVPGRSGELIAAARALYGKSSGPARTTAADSGRLAFLPPDAPDLNPIEQVFAKLRALLPNAQGAHDQRRY